MYHDHDPKWKSSNCSKNGIMSYYDPENDEDIIDSLQRQKWDDVWTNCSVEDLKEWWRNAKPRCGKTKPPLGGSQGVISTVATNKHYIDFSERLQGTNFLYM